jgi:hypothetical protein
MIYLLIVEEESEKREMSVILAAFAFSHGSFFRKKKIIINHRSRVRP